MFTFLVFEVQYFTLPQIFTRYLQVLPFTYEIFFSVHSVSIIQFHEVVDLPKPLFAVKELSVNTDPSYFEAYTDSVTEAFTTTYSKDVAKA